MHRVIHSSLQILRCAHCGNPHGKLVGEVNRAAKAGLRLYCDRVCFGLGRRKHKTKAQKVEEKRMYDTAYRKKNLALLKRKKREYFKRTYDPKEAAVYRKARMPKHVEYCRQPEYKKKKRVYDEKRRATNLHARAGLPKWVPRCVVESIELLKTLRREQKREYKRA